MESVMEASEILNRINVALTKILELGFVKPRVEFDIRPRETQPYRAYIVHEQSPGAYDKYEWFHGRTPVEALDALSLWIRDQPSIAERDMKTYLGLVAKAVEFGKNKGFETAIVNPLEEVMKRLSANVITDQSETVNVDDGIPF